MCEGSPTHTHTHTYNNLHASPTLHRGISTVKGELVPHLVRHQSLKAPPTSHTVTLGKEGGGVLPAPLCYGYLLKKNQSLGRSHSFEAMVTWMAVRRKSYYSEFISLQRGMAEQSYPKPKT